MTARFGSLLIAACWILGFITPASAQSVFSPAPTNLSPYARSVLNPYLMQNGNTTGNYSLRPFGYVDTTPTPDPTRTADSQAVGRYDTRDLDDKRRSERELQMGPTGHPTGFLIQNPYFRMANQRSFIPYNPGVGQQQPR